MAVLEAGWLDGRDAGLKECRKCYRCFPEETVTCPVCGTDRCPTCGLRKLPEDDGCDRCMDIWKRSPRPRSLADDPEAAA